MDAKGAKALVERLAREGHYSAAPAGEPESDALGDGPAGEPRRDAEDFAGGSAERAA